MSAPWKAVQQRGLGVIVQAANGEHIATVYSPKHANTIAAAPALTLQAAAFTNTVERFMRDGDGSDPRVPPTEAEVAEALYALRAAIAKATGSTHV